MTETKPNARRRTTKGRDSISFLTVRFGVESKYDRDRSSDAQFGQPVTGLGQASTRRMQLVGAQTTNAVSVDEATAENRVRIVRELDTSAAFGSAKQIVEILFVKNHDRGVLALARWRRRCGKDDRKYLNNRIL